MHQIIMANQGFIEEQHHGLYSQLGFNINSSSLTNNMFSPTINHNNNNNNHNNNNNNNHNYNLYDLKPLPSSSFALDHSYFTSSNQNPREDLSSSSSPSLVIPPQFSLNTSPIPNHGVWDEEKDYCGRKRNGEDLLGVSSMKMKKMKTRRKVREPRFCFKTMSDVDVLDDGYKWRKYGQKVVKNTLHPRSYYRCTQEKCRVKKRVERLAEDPRMVITTYEGRHVHSPSQDVDDSQATQPLLNNFFW